MRIAVAAAGRYHLLDLARELDALGARVRFYSFRPVVDGKEIPATASLPREACCHFSSRWLWRKGWRRVWFQI